LIKTKQVLCTEKVIEKWPRSNSLDFCANLIIILSIKP